MTFQKVSICEELPRQVQILRESSRVYHKIVSSVQMVLLCNEVLLVVYLDI
jgi:hypothetical protein